LQEREQKALSSSLFSSTERGVEKKGKSPLPLRRKEIKKILSKRRGCYFLFNLVRACQGSVSVGR